MTDSEKATIGDWVAGAIEHVRKPLLGDIPVNAEMSGVFVLDGEEFRIAVARPSFYEDEAR